MIFTACKRMNWIAAILCEPLTAPLHGRITQPDGFATFGSKATFNCPHGHL